MNDKCKTCGMETVNGLCVFGLQGDMAYLEHKVIPDLYSILFSTQNKLVLLKAQLGNLDPDKIEEIIKDLDEAISEFTLPESEEDNE
jgi:hypothetical protein